MGRLLIWLLIGYGIYLLIRGRVKKEVASDPQAGKDEADTYQDPVCGVYVARDDAFVGRVEGNKVYFCSEVCREKYRDQQLQHQV